MLENVLKTAQNGILDYGSLMSSLQDYRAPEQKITRLLRAKEIIRVKKGLYILAEKYRDEPINAELLANMIYGPSYVSQEYALQFYGLIPERVEVITSMTTKKNNVFSTPLGEFTYSYINRKKFTVGVDWLEVRQNVHALIASPEKAVVDTIAKFRDIKTVIDLKEHLLENMRIEREDLLNLNLEKLELICKAYRHPTVTLLCKTLKKGI